MADPDLAQWRALYARLGVPWRRDPVDAAPTTDDDLAPSRRDQGGRDAREEAEGSAGEEEAPACFDAGGQAEDGAGVWFVEESRDAEEAAAAADGGRDADCARGDGEDAGEDEDLISVAEEGRAVKAEEEEGPPPPPRPQGREGDGVVKEADASQTLGRWERLSRWEAALRAEDGSAGNRSEQIGSTLRGLFGARDLTAVELRASRLPRLVGSLRKNPDRTVAVLAAAVIGRWKALVKEADKATAQVRKRRLVDAQRATPPPHARRAAMTNVSARGGATFVAKAAYTRVSRPPASLPPPPKSPPPPPQSPR